MSVPGAPREHAGLASSFSNLALRKLYGAEFVSGAGDGIFWVALVVFLDTQPRFGLWLTLAVFARLGPRALLSVPAGSLVDRSNLRRLVVATEFARGALMLVLAIVAANGGSALTALLIVCASYTIAAPTRPALSAMVPALAGERHLAGANAVLSTVRQIMTFLGPLVGVTIAATWSPAVGFAVNAVTFAVSGVVIASVHAIPDRAAAVGARKPRGIRLGLGSSFVDGIGVVRSIAALPALVGLIGVMHFVRGAEMVLHVYVVRDQLGTSVDQIGLLGGAIGLGALVGMPLAARAADSVSPVRPIVFSLVATAVPTATLAVITRTFWACLVLILVGVGMVVFEVVIVVMVQRVTPSMSLGRVFGAINGASNTGKLMGAVSAPMLIAMVGLEGSLLVVAGSVLLIGIAATRRLVVIGRLAAARQRELAPRVGLLRTLAIFEGASRASLERIAADMSERDVAAGSEVVRQGDEPGDLYITVSGRLVASVDGRPVGELTNGDWFGEIGLFDRRRRTATVTATEPTNLWQIPGTTFLSVLESAGAPPSALVDGMTDRLATHR